MTTLTNKIMNLMKTYHVPGLGLAILNNQTTSTTSLGLTQKGKECVDGRHPFPRLLECPIRHLHAGTESVPPKIALTGSSRSRLPEVLVTPK